LYYVYSSHQFLTNDPPGAIRMKSQVAVLLLSFFVLARVVVHASCSLDRSCLFPAGVQATNGRQPTQRKRLARSRMPRNAAVVGVCRHCRHYLDRRSYQSVVQRQGRHNGLVALAALLELGHVQAAVLVLVHHAEDLPDSLLRRVFVLGQFDHGADLGPQLLACMRGGGGGGWPLTIL
jgi:hypothetical protein